MGQKMQWAVICAMLLAGSLDAQTVVDHTNVDADVIPQSFLDAARGQDILFCHMSVGMGMMSGIGKLASSDPLRYSVDVAGTGAPASWFDSHDGILDLGFSGNGDPVAKIQQFDDFISKQGYGQRADIAYMKFCYIDWGAMVNVQTTWNAYRTTLEALELAYPATTFVWVTSALNAIDDTGDKKAQFNALLRSHCQSNGKVLFDLADIESHDPEGYDYHDDYGYETIYSGYTDDNGHFNAFGRERAAKAMWALHARIVGWPAGATTLEVDSPAAVLAADGAAVTVFTARLLDGANGFHPVCPEQSVTFNLIGPGSLLGPNPVTTAGGVATIQYQAGTTTGSVILTASAGGLAPGQKKIDLIVNEAPLAPTNLKYAGQVNPVHLPHGYGDLTWTFSDPDTWENDSQGAYRVIVADSLAAIYKNTGTTWDTGKVTSAEPRQSTAVVPLEPGVLYFWKVKTWDASDSEGPFSKHQTLSLTTGVGYAAELDAKSGSIDFGSHPSLNLSAGGITIEMWVFRTEKNRTSILLDRFAGSGGYQVGIDASDHVFFRTRGAKDRRVVGVDQAVPAGAWHHIACVRTAAGDDGKVFVDGVQSGTNGLLSPPAATGAPLVLGQSGAVVDELRISSTERYTGNFTPPPGPFGTDPATVGLWHFDEGSGAVAQDATGNGIDGTLHANHGWGAGRFPSGDLPLKCDTYTLPALGGSVRYYLEAGPTNGLRSYLLFAGFTGSAPGTPLPGGLVTLPVNWDPVTDLLLLFVNTPALANFMGKLDGQGSAEAMLTLGPVPAATGLKLTFGYAMNEPWDFASNSVEIAIK